MRFVAAGVSASAAALAVERRAYGSLPLPGRARRGMPAEATMPDAERAAQLTELLHFAHLPAATAQRGRTLVAAARIAGGPAAVAARTYSEELSADEFGQRLGELLVARPHMHSRYIPEDDTLLVALTDPAPASRVRNHTFTPQARGGRCGEGC
jgi:hypothetical protein